MPNSKFQIPNSIILFLTIAIGSLFVVIAGVHAAELYLESSQPEYAPNETFSVDIRLNVIPPEDINAVEVYLSFPKDILEAVDFSTANSILTFIKNPVINQQNGLINFSGIVPGGYTGRLIGDPGKSNLLGKAIFKVEKQEKETALINFLANSQVLLNDGKGTKANLTFVPLEIQISKQEVVFNPLNEWEKAKEEDKIPPEEFKPEIVKIDDKYFLVFNSQDKQSGIDRYEIQTLKETLLGQLVPVTNFEKGESPYPLDESDLTKTIKVKAIDKAGNKRIVTLNPQVPIKWYKNYWLWGIIIILVILGLIIWRLFKLKQRFQK